MIITCFIITIRESNEVDTDRPILTVMTHKRYNMDTPLKKRWITTIWREKGTPTPSTAVCRSHVLCEDYDCEVITKLTFCCIVRCAKYVPFANDIAC